MLISLLEGEIVLSCTELLKSDVLYTFYFRSSMGETVVSSKTLLVMTSLPLNMDSWLKEESSVS